MTADVPKRYGGSLVYVFRIVLPTEEIRTRAHSYLDSVPSKTVFALDIDDSHLTIRVGTRTPVVAFDAEEVLSIHALL